MTAAHVKLVALVGDLPTATLHEAGGGIGAVPAAIGPVRPGMRVVGPALPVLSPPGDNLWLHRAIVAARPGEVLVVAFGAGSDPRGFGHWGEVMAVAAQTRGIAGLVVDGGVRDGDQLRERGFPTFSTAVAIRGTAKDPHGVGSVGLPVRLGEVEVHRGDVVVGDADGVVVLPADRAEEIVAASVRREEREREIFARLLSGASTLDVYGLPGEGS